MKKKITVQQLYDMAHKQELEEYREAVEKMIEVRGEYEYDELNETDLDSSRPTVAAGPKHYEGVADFTIVAIKEYGWLDYSDEWGNVMEDESPDTLELSHLQYVTEFVWGLIEAKLIENVKTLMGKCGIKSVRHRAIITNSYYDECHLKNDVEIVMDRLDWEQDTDRLMVISSDEYSCVGMEPPINNIIFEDRIKILEDIVKKLSKRLFL